MNGYFQLKPSPSGTALQVFAPVGGGEPVSINEVMTWLERKNIPFDLTMLNQGVEKARTENQLIFLTKDSVRPERESSIISISADKMVATMRAFAPSPGAERMSPKEIMTDLFHKGVRVGIDEPTIQEFVKNPSYCTDIVVAKGIDPQHGKDGYVEYKFNTDQHPHPTMKEDGSVDFFQMNILNLCTKGQQLAILHPSDPGQPGKNLMGEVIRPREVRNVILKYGKNIDISEDKTILTSQVDGHVTLTDGRVFVQDVISFNDVGPATGNVEFDGSIEIKGNVGTNFSVKAGGNITINGVVEGATIEAGGNVIIARGMNGMGKGTINAGGDVIVKFLENTTVNAGGFISSESILHCNISAGTDIEVQGRKGFISGGKATAGRTIRARNLGSEMANDTILSVGVDPAVKRRAMELRKRQEELVKSLQTIQPVLAATAQKIQQGAKLNAMQMQNVQQLSATAKASQEELKTLMEELQGMEGVEIDDKSCYVIVEGTVYPGVVVQISDVSMNVKKAMSYCRFIKDRGDVRITSI